MKFKKPKFWNNINFFSICLFPLSLITFAFNIFKSYVTTVHRFNIPIVCVGNIFIGGTGKTPMVEYLLAKYIEKYKIAILSRGYKRKSKGFVKLNEKSEISYVGDEPFILKKCFPKS